VTVVEKKTRKRETGASTVQIIIYVQYIYTLLPYILVYIIYDIIHINIKCKHMKGNIIINLYIFFISLIFIN
jgi:hypothetical protein